MSSSDDDDVPGLVNILGSHFEKEDQGLWHDRVPGLLLLLRNDRVSGLVVILGSNFEKEDEEED